MGFLNRHLKSKLTGHLCHESPWRPEEKFKYLEYIPKDVVTILDAGCGLGELLWIFKNKGYKVEACDVDKVCIERAKNIITGVKYADVQKLTEYYPSNSFDLITCLHVLEHLPYPYTALNELKAVTKKYVLLAMPNARCIVHDERNTHIYSWNEKTFRNILEAVGFRILTFSEDWVNIMPDLLRIPPILNKILLKIFWGPMELITLVRK